jgi:hypothetical protein
VVEQFDRPIGPAARRGVLLADLVENNREQLNPEGTATVIIP